MSLKPIHSVVEYGKTRKAVPADGRRTYGTQHPGRRTGMTLIEEMIEERLGRDAEEQRFLTQH